MYTLTYIDMDLQTKSYFRPRQLKWLEQLVEMTANVPIKEMVNLDLIVENFIDQYLYRTFVGPAQPGQKV